MSHRDRYRSRLGAVDGRRLVVVHSTWSEHSLLGRHPELPLRLVTSLPADEFAVAAVFHPNVWARHTPAGVLERLGSAVDAGLMIIPPQEGGGPRWWPATGWSATTAARRSTRPPRSASRCSRPPASTSWTRSLPPPPSPGALPRLDPEGDVLAQLLDTARRHDPADLRPVVDGQLASVDTSGEVTRADVRVPRPARSHGAPGPPRPFPYRRPNRCDGRRSRRTT